MAVLVTAICVGDDMRKNRKFALILFLLLTLLALFSCGECEHDFSEANCLEAKKCTLCGISEGSPLGHNFSEATCTAPRTCTECGAVEGEPIAHSFGMWTVKIAATCTSDGVRERVCECGEKESAVIPSSHSIKHVEAKAPDCKGVGWDAYEYCTNCDYTTYNEIPVLHNYVSTTVPPVCTVDGYTEHVCSICGDSYRDNPVGKTGHTMGKWYLSAPVTEESDGEMRSNCLNCLHYETEPLDVITSGNFGKSSTSTPSSAVTYKLFEDGTLRIEGSGATFGCGWDGRNQPFISYRDSITSIIICEGITETTGGDFASLTKLLSVKFPSTLTKLNTNAFMDSFDKSVNSITIPATVTYIGTYVFGPFALDTAVFTNITVENPNMTFYSGTAANIPKIFNGGKANSSIKLYSTGSENNVKAYANTIGATYVDLSGTVSGTVGNVKYECFDGKLSLSAIDKTAEAVLPLSSPWLERIPRASITEIEVGEGISLIAENYFKDYTSLTDVVLSPDVRSIGSGAFSCSSKCTSSMKINFPEKLSVIGSEVFKNRSAVTVSAFSGSAADEFCEDGVTVNICKVFRLLMIGNSLSLDAADCTSAGSSSVLYDIIKAMLGENSLVEIGILYSGAKTAAWHATVAERESCEYQFYFISDETDGLWSIVSTNASTALGLGYADWDYVTIQPYGSEVLNGVDDTTTGSTDKAAKFLPLSASLPYIIDCVADKAPDAQIYYYLTWSNVSSTGMLNLGSTAYEGMRSVAITALGHIGEGGKGFSGLIPVGTAIQNARSSYLATLKYTGEGDKQVGLQRDAVHLSRHVGRYIAALTFAEVLVPGSERSTGYVLPSITDSEEVGKLPSEYTEISRLAVSNAIASIALNGNDKYKPISVVGYTENPVETLTKAILTLGSLELSAENATELSEAIKATVMQHAKAGVKVSVTLGEAVSPSTTPTQFSATVNISYGYTAQSVSVNGTVKLP